MKPPFAANLSLAWAGAVLVLLCAGFGVLNGGFPGPYVERNIGALWAAPLCAFAGLWFSGAGWSEARGRAGLALLICALGLAVEVSQLLH
jgi:hypothetical protein